MLDPEGTGKVNEDAFKAHRHEIELPAEYEHVKNVKKLFAMMDKSKDEVITLYEWLNIYDVFGIKKAKQDALDLANKQNELSDSDDSLDSDNDE